MQDSAALASLMCELGYKTTAAQMKKRLESILANSDYQTFVATTNDEICGMIGTVSQPSYEHDDRGGRILALVVSKNARRIGIGRALIEAGEEDFAARGIRRIAVNTHLKRKEAHKFYRELGFERNGYRFVKKLAQRPVKMNRAFGAAG